MDRVAFILALLFWGTACSKEPHGEVVIRLNLDDISAQTANRDEVRPGFASLNPQTPHAR